MLKGFKEVSKMVQGYFMLALMILQGCFNYTSGMRPGCFVDVLRMAGDMLKIMLQERMCG
jgi:hypothetical protein